MRRLRSWWSGMVLLSRYNPSQVVEIVMLLLAVLAFLFWWARQDWQYLVLYLSYIVGVVASILAREVVAPSPHTHIIRTTAVVSLAVLLSVASVYLVRSLHLA